MTAVYELEGVVYCYDQTEVLRIDHLRLPAGVSALSGPNGSGKSTLLLLLAFLDAPSQGMIRFMGTPVKSNRLPALRRRVGLVQQNPYLLHGSVFHNVELGLKLRRIKLEERRIRVFEVLEQLGLNHLADQPTSAISGGEAQKVALARTLVLEPEILLLDEPFTHLDRHFVTEMEALIKRFEGLAVIFSTHDRRQARVLAETVNGLVSGRHTDCSLVNLFSGRRKGLYFETTGLRLLLPDTVGCCDFIAIDPHQVVVSAASIESGVPNRFSGRVVGMAEANGEVRINVDIGIEIEAIIDRSFCNEHQIHFGSQVWMAVDPSAIQCV